MHVPLHKPIAVYEIDINVFSRLAHPPANHVYGLNDAPERISAGIFTQAKFSNISRSGTPRSSRRERKKIAQGETLG